MRTLYVVTHPEATHHVDRVVGGQFNSALTPRGHRQAAAIANHLAAVVPPTADLYTSDLKRTLQTAEAIASKLALTPVLMTDLREKSYGEAGGKPQQWLTDRFIYPPPERERLHHHEGIPGAETRADLAHRTYRALSQILARNSSHQIIVTHGTALTFLITAWLRVPLESAGYASFRSTSGGITTLQEDDRYHYRTVESLNATTHLAQADA